MSSNITAINVLQEEIADLKHEIIDLKKENSHLKNIAHDYNILKEKLGKPSLLMV